MTDDVKVQLAQVKKLIEDEQYEQARQMLMGISHPTATKWLDQLNAKYPPKGSSEDRGKLNEAQALIDQERFDEATRILQTMSHDPTAQKWLSRLQNLDQGEAHTMSDSQFPAPPQITPLLKANIFDRLGKVGGLALIGAILFGIAAIVDSVLEIDSQIVYAIIATAVTALLFYGLALGLSIAFPKLQRNILFAFFGVGVGLTLVLTILGSIGVMGLINPDSQILTFIGRLAVGFGIAYVFSKGFQFVPPQGEPRLSRNMMIFLGIAITALMSATLDLRTVFITSFGGGLGFGDFLGGLVVGLISGAALGALLAISLDESDAAA